MEIRNLRFPFTSQKAWHPAGRAVSIFLDNLSIFFPAGERFFIHTVKAHAHHVHDPALQTAVKEFYAQEAYHRREHARYNEMLEAHGYPARAMEKRVERLLTIVLRVVPKRMQLAATAALEHFTATMGHMILSDARLLAGADADMAALWRWHSIEENEHKTVAYDVYLAAGGTRLERSIVMLAATVIFWLKVLEQQLRMMAADGILFDRAEWQSFFRFMFVTPGALSRTWAHWLPYFARDFHPKNLDNTALISAAARAQGLAV